MITCKNCGALLSDGTNTCIYCSSPIDSVPNTNQKVMDIQNTCSIHAESNYSNNNGQLIDIRTKPNDASKNAASNIFTTEANGIGEIIVIFDRESSTGASGTGFLIDDNGYMLTNCHVVANPNTFEAAEDLYVKIAGSTVSAKVIAIFDNKAGRGDGEDIAIIKLSTVPLSANPVWLGDSDEVSVGQDVFIYGNSLGQGLCITKGIVSDIRTVNGRVRIMTDAAMNPGNSGGPLFDENGYVIAICVAAALKGKGETADGMKYCIPINLGIKALQRTGIY